MSVDLATLCFKEIFIRLGSLPSLVRSLFGDDSEGKEPPLHDTHTSKFVSDLRLGSTMLREFDPQAQ